jgi:hypothetical protein
MTIGPIEFFGHLRWIDQRPLMAVIEPYRRNVFTEALYTFEDGRPRYNLALTGRGKKNWKSADLVLAALYRFLAWESPQGNDCFLLANDEGQAGDDLRLLKKIIAANPLLSREVTVLQKSIERADGKGSLMILPSKDAIGAHGKTYLFIGFDEIHGFRNWDIFEALAPDPARLDALTWITSYASTTARATPSSTSWRRASAARTRACTSRGTPRNSAPIPTMPRLSRGPARTPRCPRGETPPTSRSNAFDSRRTSSEGCI